MVRFFLFMFGAMIAVVASPTIIIGVPIEGIEFPQGAASFADRVVVFLPGTGIAQPYDNPQEALGVPDSMPTLALGNNGTLIIEFIDNLLIDQSDVEGGLDLFIFEVGGAIEPFGVRIGNDLVHWLDLGIVRGQPSGIDIGPFITQGESFKYVSLTDGNARRSGFPFAGADIHAVGAIGSSKLILGDYNASGIVEQADLDLVLLNWGANTPPAPGGWLNDFPGGVIDQNELDGVLLNWGNQAAATTIGASVPEPLSILAAIMLAATSLPILAKRHATMSRNVHASN